MGSDSASFEDLFGSGGQETPVFGHEEFLDRCCDDRELAVEILQGAGPDTQAYLDGVEQALQAGDARRLEATAHQLKGLAGTLAAGRVRRAAEHLEALGRGGRTDGGEEVIGLLRAEVRRFFEHAGRHL